MGVRRPIPALNVIVVDRVARDCAAILGCLGFADSLQLLGANWGVYFYLSNPVVVIRLAKAQTPLFVAVLPTVPRRAMFPAHFAGPCAMRLAILEIVFCERCRRRKGKYNEHRRARARVCSTAEEVGKQHGPV